MRSFGIELVELLLVPQEHAAVGIAVLPFLHEVAPVLARALAIRVLGIVRGLGQEAVAAAAEDDLEAVAVGPCGELLGNVLAACSHRLWRHVRVALPVAVRGVGVHGGRGGMGDASGGNDAGRLPCPLGHGGQAQDLLALRSGAVADLDLAVDSDHVVARLDAGDHRNRRRSGIGNLRVMGVGLRQGRVGQRLHAERVRLAVDAALLTFVDPAGRDRGDAHAVADEQDHVLGAVGVRRDAQPFLKRRVGSPKIGIVGLGQGVLGVRRATCGGEQRRDTDEPSHAFLPCRLAPRHSGQEHAWVSRIRLSSAQSAASTREPIGPEPFKPSAPRTGASHVWDGWRAARCRQARRHWKGSPCGIPRCRRRR